MQLAQAAGSVAQSSAQRLSNSGNAVRQAARSAFSEATDKVFLTCSIFTVAILALALLDAALVLFVFRGQGYSLQLSLAIAGGSNIGLLLLLLLVSILRHWIANRTQQQQLHTAVQSPLEPLVTPLVQLLEGFATRHSGGRQQEPQPTGPSSSPSPGPGPSPSPGPGPSPAPAPGPSPEQFSTPKAGDNV